MHDSAPRQDGASETEDDARVGKLVQGTESASSEISASLKDGNSAIDAVGDRGPARITGGRLSSVTRWIEAHAGAVLFVYLIAYAVFGVFTVRYFPAYSAPYGDEATYYSYAQHPWTLIGEFFEGYRPKEVVNPYNFRLFLTPFAVVFKLFGFTYVGARLIVFGYGLLMLWLTYAIAGHMVRPLWSLAAVVLLSVSPSFFYLTHVVRPEGMMALFVLICTWLMIRHPADLPARTYFLVGLISASTLWIHYNGVVVCPMLFVMLMGYDLRGWTRRKVAAFAAGGALFAVVFLLINLLPAWATIEEFGIMPVTFVSSSRIPFLSRNLTSLLLQPLDYFGGYFSGRCFFERQSYLFTSVLLIPMLFGLFYRSGRREWLCGDAIGLYVLFQVMVIPNLRYSYAFYVIPLAYLLVIVGLSKLPSSWDMRLLAAGAFAGIVAVYVYFDANSLKRAIDFYETDEKARKVVRELVEHYGLPETVTVMAGQEHHYFLHDTRFRTFHSAIQTRDFGKTLDLISPDIVLMRRPDEERLVIYLTWEIIHQAQAGMASPEELQELATKGFFKRRPDGHYDQNKKGVREHIIAMLADRGYVQVDAGTLTSHGSALVIFVRSDQADTSDERSASRSSG